ncbi:MAG: AbrB/MazE/SpoVT family DNA-binding domain-containing protein [Dehalococcoidia bacterium]|nr:AbrB/MazE/SpoVT family DNA-binding domain-containing protein [Dehalococcoidia bacterium]
MPTVTSKGQVTLPKQIRDALGIDPGSEVEFELEEGRAILRKSINTEVLARWEGYLRGQLPAGSVDEMIESLRGERPANNEVGK